MSYHVYTTEAYVLNTAGYGEGNKYIFLLTKDFGVVRAGAKSVREVRSKLRHALQNYSHLDVSLIQGKETWKITGVKEKENYFFSWSNDSQKQQMLANLFSLINRMHGEEKNEYLFLSLKACIQYLNTASTDTQTLKCLEFLTVLRIMHSLGYLAEKKEFKAVVQDVVVDQTMLDQVLKYQPLALSEINKSLRESQL